MHKLKHHRPIIRRLPISFIKFIQCLSYSIYFLFSMDLCCISATYSSNYFHLCTDLLESHK